jgi:hypothetical protein
VSRRAAALGLRMTCAAGSLLIDGPDGPVKEGRVLEASCNNWRCPVCGPRKRRAIQTRLAKRLEDVRDQERLWLMEQGSNPDNCWRPFKFLTLTTDIKYFIDRPRYQGGDWRALPEEAEAAHRAMMRAWNKLHAYLTWMRRQTLRGPRARWEGNPLRIQYFGVLEYTKNGWPHLHIVILWRERFSGADITTIRRLWDDYGIGQSVKLTNKSRHLKEPASIASYLAKYLSKDLPEADEDDTSGRRIRRIFSSRGFLPPKERRRDGSWAGWSNASVARHRAEREASGARTKDISRGFSWESDGISEAIDPLRRVVWQELHDAGLAAQAPPVEQYRYVGPAFALRLRLPPERSAKQPDGSVLLVPEHLTRRRKVSGAAQTPAGS